MVSHFALRLIFGMSLMWCLMPRGQVTSGFFRIQMLVALGLSVLAALTLGKFAGGDRLLAPLLPEQAGVGLCAALAGLAFLGSVWWTLERRTGGGRVAWLIAGLSLATLWCSSPRLGPISQSAEMLRMVSDVSSAALLGGAMTAMLLGHWYLTAPTMLIEPLKKVNAYFAGAGALRLVASAAGLALAWGSLEGSTHWMWLSLRWTAGVFGPLAVAWMVWRILRYRNTQAATGVLFVGVILTFIGEMTASLLFAVLAIPL